MESQSKEKLIKRIDGLEKFNKKVLEKIDEYDRKTYKKELTQYIRNYGKENMNCITDENCLSCLKYPTYGVIILLKKLYFNQKYPENSNITIDELDVSILHIFRNGTWYPTKVNDDIIYRLVTKVYNIYLLNYEKERETMTEERRVNFENFQKRYLTKDDNFMSFYRDEIPSMFYIEKRNDRECENDFVKILNEINT
ncbi:unnamed protein product [marine sediment metagenome]|uniref:Uncharacterized protein n=1 Tax=marine sediment metagenome TaxID=412755 RepID=X0YIB9_9ZZZZ